MRIPLNVKDIYGGPKPILTLFLSIPHASGYIEAVVDTGGPVTILSPRDADRLHFPFQACKREETPHNIGALSFYGYKFENSEIIFRDDYKNRLKRKIPITGLKPIKTDNVSLQRAYQLPNVLGMDFLIVYNLSLYFYPKGKIAYLQLEEEIKPKNE